MIEKTISDIFMLVITVSFIGVAIYTFYVYLDRRDRK
jgi:hypothetical protein